MATDVGQSPEFGSFVGCIPDIAQELFIVQVTGNRVPLLDQRIALVGDTIGMVGTLAGGCW